VLDSGGVVDLLFVPLVVMLAIGAGTLPRLLSVRALVYGGQISFSLYMVHELVHTAWNWAAEQFELRLDGPAGPWWLMAIFAVTLACSALLYHVVEEPARHWMRRMVDIRGTVSRMHPADTDRAESKLSA
jgi:peptidoglycan/LPS O-acetylase OafA/YrhL